MTGVKFSAVTLGVTGNCSYKESDCVNCLFLPLVFSNQEWLKHLNISNSH